MSKHPPPAGESPRNPPSWIEPIERRLLLATTLPAGFTETQIANGLTSPTALDVAPDGRVFFTDQSGHVRVIQNDALQGSVFADLSAKVDSNGERGMLGIAVDPNFANTHYVYVYYTTHTPTIHNRLSRLTADPNNLNVMLPGSEVHLLDLPDLTEGTIWHMGGSTQFGPDGRIYISVGDHEQSALAQSMTSVLGKILRVNPDGTIPTDNPFYNQTTGINRAIWALGLRNPFTTAFQPGTGRFFINDVGQDTWEEIDDGIAGKNYGWPNTEGTFVQGNFPSYTEPVHTYQHLNGRICIIGGAFYNPTNVTFPQQYVGKYFFMDFGTGEMWSMDPATKAVSNFATGLAFPDGLELGNNGALYYLARGVGAGGQPGIGTGKVYKIQYTANTAPGIVQQPQNALASVGFTATFSVSANGTAPLSYQWTRNDVDILGANSSTYTTPNTVIEDNGAQYRCRVSNIVDTVTSNPATLSVTAKAPPNPVINLPIADTTYRGGDTVHFSGSATDGDGNPMPASAMNWRIDFHHDEHSHPFYPPTSGIASGSVIIPVIGETASDVWYRIHLTVTDSLGLVSDTFRDITPIESHMTLLSNVPGLQVKLDNQPVNTPYEFDGVAGLLRSLNVDTVQSVDGISYVFTGWSDGSATNHAFSFPDVDTTITANFAPVTTTYLSALTAASSTNGWGLMEKDKSNGESGATDGKTITLNGVTYSKGLGVHAASTVIYNLNGQYALFLSDVGVDDEVTTAGSVVFQVWLDNIKVFDSGVMTGLSSTQQVAVDTTGKNQLKLIVTDGGNGNTLDHADWANARLTNGGPPPPPPPPSLFAAPVSYPTGVNAHGVSAIDLNGDGKLDLAVANANSNTVSVLFGNGNGTFQPAVSYAVGSTPKTVIAKDLNGDGKPDLVTPNQGAATISVLLNKGDGTFFPKVDYLGTSGAHDVALADLDGDTDIDIVEAGWGANLVRVLFNQGNGTFAGGTNYVIGNAPHSVVAVDFNGDNKPDLAVADYGSNHVAVLLNNGNGTFSPAVFMPVGTGPHSIRSGDLNGDGKLDLATANEAGNTVSVLLSNGNGTFTTVTYPAGSSPRGVAIGDVNGDGKPDLLGANTGGNYPAGNNPAGMTISVLLNLGSGTFGAANDFAAGHTPFSVTLGDFDGDGDLDAATANWNSNDVTVLRNQSTTGPAGNQAPIANADSISTPLNQSVAISVLSNDIDFDGTLAVNTLTITTPAVHGTTSVNAATGVVTYTPAADYTGPDEFFYIIKDDKGAVSQLAKVSISVNPPQTPQAQTVYLSDLTPVSSSNGWGPAEKDRSNGETGATDGHTLTLNGQTYTKGWGVHASSTVIFNLNGQYTQFLSDVGVDDEVGTGGSVVFEVWVDNVKLFDSGTMNGATATKQAVVDVAGKSQLKLVVTDSGNGNTADHADWANARLTQGVAVAPPAAPGALNAVYNAATSKIDLSWSDLSSDESGFRVERKTGVNGVYAQVADLGAGTQSYSDGANLVGGNTYYYRAYAYKTGAANSGFSESNAAVPAGQQQPTVYLSDLTPITAVNGWGPYEKNRSNNDISGTDGRTITLNTQAYAKGLGTHANSNIVYNLGGLYTQFLADVGVDDEVGNNGSVVFQVWVDNVKVYDSGTMTGAMATNSVVVDVTGKSQLKLIVTDSGNGSNYDHADWANARLMQGAAPTPPATPGTLNAVYNAATSKIDLTWSDLSSDETGFRIERKTAAGVYAQIADLPAGTQNYSDGASLVAGTTYFYRVHAYKTGAANSAFSNEPSAAVPGAPQTTVYLSDLTPASAANGWGSYEKNRSNGEIGATDGHTITLGGQTYAKGLGTHATSTIVYNLNGQYTQFLSDIGVDDEVGNNGSVVFQVWLDNVKVYDSGTMTGATATKSIALDVTGKAQLKLIVTDSGNGPNFDHADWAAAKLMI